MKSYVKYGSRWKKFAIVTGRTPNYLPGFPANHELFANLMDVDFYYYEEEPNHHLFAAKWDWIRRTFESDLNLRTVLWIDYDIVWLGLNYLDCKKFYDTFLFHRYDFRITGGWPSDQWDAKYHSAMQVGWFSMRRRFADWFFSPKIFDKFIDYIREAERRNTLYDQYAFIRLFDLIPEDFVILIDNPPWYVAPVVSWNKHPFLHLCGVKDKVATAKRWIELCRV